MAFDAASFAISAFSLAIIRGSFNVVSDEGVSRFKLREKTSWERTWVTAAKPRNSAMIDAQIAPLLVRISAGPHSER